MKGQNKMKISDKMLKLALAGVAVAMLSVSASAQGYYDDDIYFDASKTKAAKPVRKVTETPASTVVNVSLSDLKANYATVSKSTSTRDVDEYNRRGDYKPVDNSSVDDLGDNFEYTRRIERFYNSDIVNGSDDEDLIYYYHNANDELADVNRTSPTTINIYVENPDPWTGFWSPYYYSSAWSWAWRPSHYYNPWYSWNYAWGYGPSWSLSWGWGPSWDFGWHWGWHYPSYGWGWSPAWGWNHPGHGWGGSHHPNYPGHHWGWTPSRPTGPGASRPSARPGVVNRSSSARPSRNGILSSPANRVNGRTTSARPSGASSRPAGAASTSSAATRSSNVRSGYVPGRTAVEGASVSVGRNTPNSVGRNGVAGSSTSGRTSSSSRNSSSTSSSSSSPSYNRSSSSSSNRSSGFSSGSSSSGRSSGGASYSGGGRSGGGGRH